MWINARFLDAQGRTLKETGRYEETDDTLLDRAVRVPDLVDPEETRVYEILFAMSESTAARYGKQPGKSFRSVLNDVVIKDNRIPPEGFKNRSYAEHLCQPVGATYADGQHWDEIDLKLPPACRKVVVRLMYQSVSWEYLKFLVEENHTDDWDKRLYEAWAATGKGEPEVMAEVEAEIAP